MQGLIRAAGASPVSSEAQQSDTGVASAAVEELMALAEGLEQQGKLYAALDIFNKLEQLL